MSPSNTAGPRTKPIDSQPWLPILCVGESGYCPGRRSHVGARGTNRDEDDSYRIQPGLDPVKMGFVDSLNRPGGNVTGVTFLANELEAKQLDLLSELVPRADAIAYLVNPSNPNTATAVLAAGQVLGRRIHVLNASAESDLDSAFAGLGQQGAGALLISPDPLFTSRREQIVSLALRHAVPTMYQYREHVAAGGLISYGVDLKDTYRQHGIYVGRILKGASPADLPVMQPTKFELVINLKTAKALGLTVPPTLLARADEVIE